MSYFCIVGYYCARIPSRLAYERQRSDRHSRCNQFNARAKVRNNSTFFIKNLTIVLNNINNIREKLLEHMKGFRNIHVLFIESDLTDPKILEANIMMKLKSPDYKLV